MSARMSKRRVRSFFVIFVCLIAGNVSAVDGISNQTTTDPCGDVEKLTSDERDLQALYDQVRVLCAQRKVSAISRLAQTEKYAAIATALTDFGAIPVNRGAITAPEKAEHIGIWQAQRTLFDAAVSVGEEVRLALQPGKKYLLLTDPLALQQRASVRAAIAQFDALNNQLQAISALLAETEVRRIPEVPKMMGMVPPSAFPSLITAAQAIVGLAKTDMTLFTLTPSAQKEVIWAGICSKGCRGVVIPTAAMGSVVTDLQKNYSTLLNTATAARKTYGNAQASIEKAGDDEKVSTNLKSLRDALGMQLVEYDALVRNLQTVQPGKTTTLLEDLTQMSLETLGSSDFSGTLLVTASAFGGHGGVRSSIWRNDRILFETTVALSYTLFDADGTVLKAGFSAKRQPIGP